MKRLLLITAIVAVATACRAGDEPTEAGFTALFNGKDLTGWTIENKGKFAVKNGVIVLDKGSGWLRSDNEYQDFTLRLDFRFVSKGADSGIFLRASKEGPMWPAKSYQVQTMDNDSIAAVFATGLDRVKMKRDAALMRKVRKSVGEWQTYDITVQGAHAEVRLNGELITSAAGLTVRAGYIGLQGEGGQLEFRNIRVKAISEK